MQISEEVTFKEVGAGSVYDSRLIYYPLKFGEQTIGNIKAN
jgi:hypothetical protein